MKNNIRTFTKENFNLQEFVDFTKDCNTNAIIYNSYLDLKTTEEILRDNLLHNFRKITSINSDHGITAYFKFYNEPEFDGYSLQDFYNFYNGLIYANTKLPINSNCSSIKYINIVCTEDVIILCAGDVIILA